MKIALLSADKREDSRDYNLPAPCFDAATEALLQGFATMPELEVHVVSCAQKPLHSPEKLAENIKFHGLYVPKPGWMKTSYQGCIRAVRRRLKVIRPDIVHGLGTERDCAVSAAFSRFPNVVTVHGNMTELARIFKAPLGTSAWLAAQLESIALQRTRGVFCNSEYTESLVKPRSTKTWCVPHAIREDFFKLPKAGIAPEKCILLNIGIISERKRQVELLDVARRLHESGSNCEFQFIGPVAPGDYGASFLQNLKEAEAKGYARHLGFKSTTDLVACCDAAHALVHFPSEEAFGLAVAEGMARDLKIFASRVGGIVDVADGVTGAELFAADDWDGLTTGITNWIRQGKPKPDGNSRIMNERYHPRVIAQRHLEIYREVLGSVS
jgi:glycosyltransferase involved in cell wall biosynthesis